MSQHWQKGGGKREEEKNHTSAEFCRCIHSSEHKADVIDRAVSMQAFVFAAAHRKSGNKRAAEPRDGEKRESSINRNVFQVRVHAL